MIYPKHGWFIRIQHYEVKQPGRPYRTVRNGCWWLLVTLPSTWHCLTALLLVIVDSEVQLFQSQRPFFSSPKIPKSRTMSNPSPEMSNPKYQWFLSDTTQNQSGGFRRYLSLGHSGVSNFDWLPAFAKHMNSWFYERFLHPGNAFFVRKSATVMHHDSLQNAPPLSTPRLKRPSPLGSNVAKAAWSGNQSGPQRPQPRTISYCSCCFLWGNLEVKDGERYLHVWLQTAQSHEFGVGMQCGE